MGSKPRARTGVRPSPPPAPLGGRIEIQVARRYAEQLARSASEAATEDGNARWLVEDIAGLFQPEHEEVVARELHGDFFAIVAHCVTQFQDSSRGDLTDIFDHIGEYFAPPGFVFAYEGGRPPPIVPKGYRAGLT
jgi:hypothetical protein